MEFSSCNYTRNPNIDFKFVSYLYFTKNLHCEIINRLLGSNIVLNTKPFDTNYGEVSKEKSTDGKKSLTKFSSYTCVFLNILKSYFFYQPHYK